MSELMLSPRLSSPTFVGRTAERQAIVTALERARDGAAGVVLVGGESGVGKSRLLEDVVPVAQEHGALVLTGHCLDLAGGALPFAPVAGALRPLARSGHAAIDDLPAATRAALHGLLPELGGDPGAAPRVPETSSVQAALYEAVLGLLDRLGRESPVMLVIEDLHWADASTRDLFAFLVRNFAEERALVVATYRTDELHRRHPLRPLLARLETDRRVTRLDLAPFEREELDRQLAGILGEAPEPDLARRIHSRAQGNPLFAEELLSLARAQGGMLGCDLPDTLRDALLLRTEPLSPAARAVLRVAAVVDRPMSHGLLVAACDLDAASITEGAREAIGHHILVTDADGRYAFRHALVGEAVYGDLLPGEQTELHVAVARALEADPALLGDDGAVDAELAVHYSSGQLPGPALASSVRAAKRAADVFGYAEARRHYERALELWPRVEDPEGLTGIDHVLLLSRTAWAMARLRDHGRAVKYLRKALAEVDRDAQPERAAGMLAKMGRDLWGHGRSEEAFAAFDEANALLGPDPSPDRATLLSNQARAFMLSSEYQRGRDVALEAAEMAARLGLPDEESRALNTLGVCLAALGDLPSGERALQQGLAIAKRQKNPADVAYAAVNLSDSLDRANQTRRGLDVLAEGMAWLRGYGIDVAGFDLFMLLQEVLLLWRLGRWDEARAKLPPGPRGPDEGLVAIFFHQMQGEIALGIGDMDVAERELQRMAELCERVVDSQWNAPLHAGLARLAVARGDHDRARALIATGLRRIADGEDDCRAIELHWAGLHVEAERTADLRARGRAPDNRAIVDDLLASLAEVVRRRRAPDHVEQNAWLETAHAEAARALSEDGPERWQAAAALFGSVELVWPTTYTQVRAAEALVAAGDRPAAAELLGTAARAAASLGAVPLITEIEALARRARLTLETRGDEVVVGAEPDGADEVDPAADLGLTAREREVLLLLADGRTNRQIAETLFMSEKTASVHVSRILAKLDVSGRVEAAAVAHRIGLVGLAERHP